MNLIVPYVHTLRAKSLFLLSSGILQIDQLDPPCCDCSAGDTPQNESHLHLHLYLQALQFPCKIYEAFAKQAVLVQNTTSVFAS